MATIEPASLERLLQTGAPPCVIVGAGGSYPLPTAVDLKRWLLDALIKTAGASNDLGEVVWQRLQKRHMTLELFFSMCLYRFGPVMFDAQTILRAALTSSVLPPLSLALAHLRSEGRIGAIITTNFDCSLPFAHRRLSGRFRLVTEAQAAAFARRRQTPSPHDIVAVHGTLMRTDLDSLWARLRLGSRSFTPPATSTARSFARPLTPHMEHLLRAHFARSQSIVTVGYRGGDNYDLNLLFKSLVREDASFAARISWLSFKGDASDLDPFVLNHFPGRCFAGDLMALLAGDPHFRESLARLPTASGADNDIRANAKAACAAKLQTAWNSPSARTAAHNVLQDIACNVPSCWAAGEHYFLESVGFEPEQIRVFGGIADDPHSDALEFHGEDIGVLLRILETYRNEQARLTSAVNEGTLFADTEALCISALEQFQRLVTNKSLRPVDRAIVLVFESMVYDYLGLVYRQRSLLEANLNAADKRERLFKAIELFARTTALASIAKQIVVDAGPQSDGLLELTGCEKWMLAGPENISRTREFFDRGTAIEEYWSAIRARRAVTRSRGQWRSIEYLPAHLPQLALRCAECVKAILEPADGMTVAAPLRGRLSSIARQSLAIGFDAYRRFQALSSRPNYRFIALFEAAAMHGLAHNRRGAARRMATLMLDYFGKDLTEGRSAGFAQTFAKWLNAAAQQLDDSSLSRIAQEIQAAATGGV